MRSAGPLCAQQETLNTRCRQLRRPTTIERLREHAERQALVTSILCDSGKCAPIEQANSSAIISY